MRVHLAIKFYSADHDKCEQFQMPMFDIGRAAPYRKRDTLALTAHTPTETSGTPLCASEIAPRELLAIDLTLLLMQLGDERVRND